MKKKYIPIFFLFCSLFIENIKAQIINTIAGTSTTGYNGDGILATTAQLDGATGVSVDAAGNVYIADQMNHRIRKVDVNTGLITTVAGIGTGGFSGDGGLATAAQLNRPYGVDVDPAGNIYISDYLNNRVRKVDIGGTITTIAGTGTAGFSGDGGLATAAQLNAPLRVAFDAAGNIYIADAQNHRIRKINGSTGIITTVAGTIQGFAGDGGLATSAQLNFPHGIVIDPAGNIYIGDKNNYRIRKVNAGSGIINTIAGIGTFGSSGDGGSAITAQLGGPDGIVLDGNGNIYLADENIHRVRRIDAITGIITTIAGTGTLGFSGDGGPATAAQLFWDGMLAIDAFCNLYIAEPGNNRIRKITGGVAAPDLEILGDDTICAGSATILTANGGSNFQWNTGDTTNSINIAPTINVTYTLISSGCASDTASLEVVVHQPPVVTAGSDDTICFGQSIIFSAGGGVGAYSWNTGSVNQSITATTAGDYIVTLTDTNNCMDKDTVHLVVNPLPVLTVTGDTMLCVGESTTLAANGADNYQWNTGTNNNIITLSPIVDTSYYTLTGTNTTGCIDSVTITVIVNPFPSINAGPDDTICSGESTQLNASGGNSYQWIPSTNLSASAIQGPTANPITTITYTVTGTDGNNCMNTDTVTVFVESSAIAEFTATPTEGQVPLTVNFSNTSSNANIYEWDFGDNNTSTDVAPIHVYTEGGEYTVQLIANNNKNCPDTSVYTFIKIDATSVLWVPNSFTPNADGVNDIFIVYTYGITKLEVSIYNRWGEKITDWNTTTGSWDGNYKNKEVELGVYVYVVKATGIDGKTYNRIGHLSLIR